MKEIKNNKTSNLLYILSEMKDLRRKQWTRYKLEDVILMIIMWIMWWAKSERWICRFIENNSKEIIEKLKIERNSVPSRNALRKIIWKLDFDKIEDVFYMWSKQIINIEKWEWISIDGKAIRWTLENPNNSMQNFLSLVTLFVSKRKQALSIWKINNKKESEIPKVKDLIKQLDLENVIFTIDALHCQKETTKTIIEKNNDYVIWVKWNQKKLYNQLKKTQKVEILNQ